MCVGKPSIQGKVDITHTSSILDEQQEGQPGDFEQLGRSSGMAAGRYVLYVASHLLIGGVRRASMIGPCLIGNLFMCALC